MRSFCILMLTALTSLSYAQRFHAESNLPPVVEDGFYRINLSPDISPYVNRAITNVRIIDSKGKEVPYLFEQEQPSYQTTVFRDYSIVSKDQKRDCCTSLVLHNPQSKPINNISLSIRNAEVTKRATLMGSDDKINWYALKEQFVIHSISDQHNTSTIRIVDFPLSNYAYYKLDIEDSISAPLNILAAGYYEMMTEDGKFTEVAVRSHKVDSARMKTSFLILRFDTVQVIDKIILSMKGTPYFLRRGAILQKMQVKSKKKESFFYNELVQFILSSKQPATIELDRARGNEFVIRIDNDDNPPLEISSVKAFQLNRYLTAWLNKDERYSLNFGDESMQSPTYDIGYFKENIPEEVTTLNASAVHKYVRPPDSPRSDFFTSRIIIWTAIVSVIIALGIMAIKMVRETSAR